jgi:hypothetical protein
MPSRDDTNAMTTSDLTCASGDFSTLALLERVRKIIAEKDENGVQKWLSQELDIWARQTHGDPKRHKRGYSLTFKDIYALAVEQQSVCAISGLPFEPKPRTGRYPFSVSVDRIDHTRGYEPGNVRLVCAIANYARNSFEDDDVIKLARAIVAKHGAA